MIREHYFLVGTSCGVLLVLGILGPLYARHLLTLESHPFWAGVVFSLLCSWAFDYFELDRSTFWYSGVVLPGLIYLLSVFLGCLVNLGFNWNGISSVESWFMKPFYWFTLIGLPISIVLGAFYFWLFQRLS